MNFKHIPSTHLTQGDTVTSDAGGGQDVLYQVFIHPCVTFEPLSTDPDHLRLLQDTNLQLELHGHLSKV